MLSNVQNVNNRKHGEKLPTTCIDCGKVFANHSSIKTQKNTVHTQSQNICNICGKMFSNNRYLRCHVRKVHELTEHVYCELCSKEYSGKTRLYHHLRAVHTEEISDCESSHSNLTHSILHHTQ